MTTTNAATATATTTAAAKGFNPVAEAAAAKLAAAKLAAKPAPAKKGAGKKGAGKKAAAEKVGPAATVPAAATVAATGPAATRAIVVSVGGKVYKLQNSLSVKVFNGAEEITVSRALTNPGAYFNAEWFKKRKINVKVDEKLTLPAK